MRTLALILLILLPSALRAQLPAVDPLEVTLPSGKVVHFSTAEAKAKYLAALAARQQPQPATVFQSPPAAPAVAKPLKFGSTSLDEKPSGTGRVNVNAPAFTADYYMLAPDTWVGKKVTLSINSLNRRDTGRKDGLVELLASTANAKTSSILGQESGGSITVLATPTIAERLLLQCGTSIRYLGGGIDKTTMIKGEFRANESVSPYTFSTSKGYAVFVEK